MPSIPNQISEKDWQRIKDTLMLLKNILGEPWNKLSILLGDSTNLREWFGMKRNNTFKKTV